MASLKLDGRVYALPDSDDWTTAELSEAESALGVAFGDKSQGDAMAISFFIAVRRVEKDTPPVVLADKVRQIKMRDLSLEDDEDEKPPFDPADPSTIGRPPLEALGS
jgi:hypothetical protein